MVRAELLFGAVKSSNPLRSWAAHEHFLSQYACVEFDEPSAQVFARLRFDLERTGASIGPYDLQIAAIAVAHGLTLITHNVKEFSRVNGLKLVDWEA